ncbi:MAG: hypothetical protein FWC27_06465 [Firmicutes bacterium]|nr:hypothetical protein [Bacillota bacterium]
MLRNFEYQSECELVIEAADCLKRMADIAAQATDPDDQDYILERCIGLANRAEGKSYGAAPAQPKAARVFG